MHITARQEQFSRSTAYAVASRAGCAISLRNVDDDSVDLTLCSKLLARRPSVDVQLKCTSQDVLGPDSLTISISIKNYNDLRVEDLLVPRILVVMIVPTDLEDWLEATEERMIIRRCGYWRSLRGHPDTPNTDKISVTIPRTNLFTPESLTAIMHQVHNGDEL